MKIAKALKLKNQLACDIAQLKELLAKQKYVAQLGKVDVDKLVAGLQDEIQTLQDALDEFNFTRSVNA